MAMASKRFADLANLKTLFAGLKQRYASLSHTHAASDITSGTLGVSRGGTGASTITGIVKGNGTSAMGAASASDVVNLLDTNAVNRATADGSGNNIVNTYATKTALDGKADASHTHSGYQPQHTTTRCTLTMAGWSNNSQTVNTTGVTASNTVIVAPAPECAADWAAAGVVCTTQGSGTLTFTCTTAPTATLRANVLVLEEGVASPTYSITYENTGSGIATGPSSASEGESVTITIPGTTSFGQANVYVLKASDRSLIYQTTQSGSATIPLEVTFEMPAFDVVVYFTRGGGNNGGGSND